jgi:calcineurin-like phosphoesterase family protein/2'-5' RNA ligase
MNEALVRNWNQLVAEKDTVYFLGDWSFGRNSRPASYWVNRLNGHIICIKGNHDKTQNSGVALSLYKIINHNGYKFLLIHDPNYRNNPVYKDVIDKIKDWNGWVIHGHVHNKSPFINGEKKNINVSVDMTGFKPINLDYLCSLGLDSERHIEKMVYTINDEKSKGNMFGRLKMKFSNKSSGGNSRGARYLIEVRLFGEYKHGIKEIIYDVRNRYKIGGSRPVPHITLAGSLTTNNEARLLRDFEEVCRGQKHIMEFRFNGFGSFDDNRVIKVNIEPDGQLVEFRWALLNRLRDYCQLNKPFDDNKTFEPHTTIAMKLTDKQLKNIKQYIEKYPSPMAKQCVARITLIKNRSNRPDDAQILAEYDFFLKKVLSRKEAKDVRIKNQTWVLLKEYIHNKGYIEPDRTSKPHDKKKISFGKIFKRSYYFCKSFFKWLKRFSRTFWQFFKRLLVLVCVLGITSIILAAVSSFIKTSEVTLEATIIISLVGLALIIWGLISISRYRLSFTRTFIHALLSVIVAVLSCAYLNIQSVDDIKDKLQNLFASETGQLEQNLNDFIGRIELHFIEDIATETLTVTSTIDNLEKTTIITTVSTNAVLTTTSNTKTTSTEYVYQGRSVVIGADGHRITLVNNNKADNPTWAELVAFLQSDHTDEIIYDYDTFVCADFAELLHNNAEAAGIKAGYVCITLGPADYSPFISGHALNMFETTDRGLVFIDCTGYTSDLPISADKLVDVEVGKDYLPQNIFASNGWYWSSMGEVISIDVLQW